jgi:cholesterol oxidase
MEVNILKLLLVQEFKWEFLIVFDFDYIIIGSGFGGSVSALRLSQKGYKVAIIEAGKRYSANDFPKSNWNFKKYFWFPFLRCFGIFKMNLFKHVFILSGAGVGGGSLVYANTLLTPKSEIWDDQHWKELSNWHEEMPGFYDTAKKMLGVNENTTLATADHVLKTGADEIGIGNSFYKTDVGIYFGEPGVTVKDPYFDGEGPDRTGCELCGGCMVGCRYDGKNTLDKNYLYLAEKKGVKIFPELTIDKVIPLGGPSLHGESGYEVSGYKTTDFCFKEKKSYTSSGVIFAAGVLGTIKLLFSMKEKGFLPDISTSLGHTVRTNSESIIGMRTKGKEYNMSEGIAIGSGIYVDEDTHIEAVRYPLGSGSLTYLTTILVKGGKGISRPFEFLKEVIMHPLNFLSTLNPFKFARQTIILLCMQAKDGQMKFNYKRSILNPFTKNLSTEQLKEKIPTFIPSANNFVNKLSKLYKGTPITSIFEIFFDMPTTAHILGGAVIGKNQDLGVIDKNNKMFNYKNLYVCDGSMIGVNLGVNPSLTITALTERAMSRIPLKKKV